MDITLTTIYNNEEGYGELDKLADSSAFTIIGAGGDLKEWMGGINEMLKTLGIGEVDHFYTFKGDVLNDRFYLRPENRVKKDLTFLCFKIDKLNIGKLAVFKMKFGAAWLDDIIQNRLQHQYFG